MKKWFVLTIALGICVVLYAQDSTAEKPSADYTVRVSNKDVFVYNARVSAMPINVWPGVTRPLEQTELAAFCSFGLERKSTITVTAVTDVKSVVIRPLALHIKPIIKGNKITFTLDKPGQVVVEVNGWHKALHVFANPLAKAPREKRKNDLYFGPGVHYPGVIQATSDQVIYLAAGAVVYGAIYGKNIKNLTIEGSGILDGSRFQRNVDTVNVIKLFHCENVTVRGIVLRDPQIWTFLAYESDGLYIDNVKLVGLWRYNADGIDILNSRHVTIKNSFVRAFDDCIVIKGVNAHNIPESALWNISDVSVENCVVWGDWGRGLEIGAETVADSIHHIRYKNIDIIHYVHIALDIQNGNHAAVSDVVYDDIRVEDPLTENAYLDDLQNPVRDLNELKNNPRNTKKFPPEDLGRLFVIEIKENGWVKDSSLGSVDDILFKNISYHSSYVPLSFLEGNSDAHAISNVRFENVYINGKKITSAADGHFTVKPFVKNLSFR